MSTFTQNPFTGRKIEIGGKTHQLVQQIMAGPGTAEQKRVEYLKMTHPTTKSKYLDVPENLFCGTSGGYPAGTHTFPVDSEKRCRAALSYSRYAPDPQGVRDCALKIAKEKGWNCGKYSHPGKKKKSTGTKKLNGYQLFTKAELPKLKAQGITGKAAITKAAANWKAMSKAEQDAYKEQAKKL